MLQGEGLNAFGPLQVGQRRRNVAEGLDAADDLAVGVAHRGDERLRRHPPPILGLGVDDHGHLAGRAGDHGPVQRAELLAAEAVAVLVHVAQHVFQAAAAHHVRRGPAGDSLGRFAPVDDASVLIADVGAVAQRIEDDAGKSEQFVGWRLHVVARCCAVNAYGKRGHGIAELQK